MTQPGKEYCLKAGGAEEKQRKTAGKTSREAREAGKKLSEIKIRSDCAVNGESTEEPEEAN